MMRYRENTIHSFNVAAEAGASFVEFDVQVRFSTPFAPTRVVSSCMQCPVCSQDDVTGNIGHGGSCEDDVSVMQVTADGIPVIWHDDLVVSLPEQPSGRTKMQRICELSLRDFKKLSQHRSVSNQPGSSSISSAAASSLHSEEAQHSSQSASLTDTATQQAQHEQSCAPAQAASGATGARLARYFNSDHGKRMHAVQAWSVSEEDSLPTLAEVFQVRCGSLL